MAAIWDDHEVANDFDGSHFAVAEGRTALREYWPMRTADPTVLYRRLSWGPAADVVILDTRQYRSPNATPDGPGKTMLGRRQKEWLKEELRASRAPFKFVVSSVPFLGPFGTDKWNGFATERDELKRFFRQERIGGLVFLSADMHLAMDLADRDGLRDFIAGPIGAWPFCRIAAPPRPAAEHRALLPLRHLHLRADHRAARGEPAGDRGADPGRRERRPLLHPDRRRRPRASGRRPVTPCRSRRRA